MAQESLKNKAAKGMMWTTIQRFANMGIQFISGIILARLLTPADYGAIGMLTIFMMVSQQFIDGGFGSALIQKKNPTQDDYSTIFWWNIGMGVFLYLVLFVSAPYIAQFYHMDILCPVLRVQALTLIISGLNAVQGNQMNKQFRFNTLAKISVLSSVLGLIVTVFLAYSGCGVWSLVAQSLVVCIIPTIFYWLISDWRPLFMFSKKSFKELASFGIFMFFNHVINDFCNNIQGLLIGRFYTATTMGFYSKAHSTEKLASNSISMSLRQVTFPLYAELQNDKQALIGVIKKLTTTVAFATFPLMFLLILIAKPVFVLLYSDRWLESVPYFQLLCLSGIAVCLQAINLQAISAIGKSKLSFNWTLIKRSIGLGTIFLGLYIAGIWGLMVAIVFNSWLFYIVNAWLVSKYIGYKMRTQMVHLLPIFSFALIAFVFSFFSVYFVELNIYVEGMVKLFVYVCVYVSLSAVTKNETYLNVIELVRKSCKRLKKSESFILSSNKYKDIS